MNKPDIKNFTLEELKEVVVGLKQPQYRAEQIFHWLYQRGAPDFNKMDDIPKPLRDRLEKDYYIGKLVLREHLKSTDGTEKFLFKLCDGNFIESVLIYAGHRKTICLSSQVGCRFACSFCASAREGLRRNLTPSEITGQILLLQHKFRHKISNYVFMGMGEPLDNFKNLKKALAIMGDPKGMNIGARRITLSTCGIVPEIEELWRLGLQVNLSVSLHAPDDKLRDTLMPINKRYPLAKLIKACGDYIHKTGRMITLEYVLIKAKNDSLQDAEKLARIAGLLKAKVNLIAYSQTSPQGFQVPEPKDIEIFRKELKKRGVQATLRASKGRDIQASCGQLAGRKRE